SLAVLEAEETQLVAKDTLSPFDRELVRPEAKVENLHMRTRPAIKLVCKLRQHARLRSQLLIAQRVVAHIADEVAIPLGAVPGGVVLVAVLGQRHQGLLMPVRRVECHGDRRATRQMLAHVIARLNLAMRLSEQLVKRNCLDQWMDRYDGAEQQRAGSKQSAGR